MSTISNPATAPDRGLMTWIPNPLPYMPFAYHQALRNRLPAHKLDPNGSLDTTVYPALFFYDMLQFPGTISTLLEPSRQLDPVGRRMTPGTLHGFKARVRRGTGEPMVKATGRDADVVKGMVVFGRGRDNRITVGKYYGGGYKRVKGEVRIVLESGRKRDVEAFVWVWDGEEDDYLCIGGEAVAWNLEKYAAGDFQ